MKLTGLFALALCATLALSCAKKETAPAPEAPAAEAKAEEAPAAEVKKDEAPAAEVKPEEAAAEPKAEEPKAEEPKAEEPKAEEPKAEEPKAEVKKDEVPADEAKKEEVPAEEAKEGEKMENAGNPGEVTTASGLKYIDLTVGSGDTPRPGQHVTVHYTGWLASNNQKFDSSVDRGQPFQFIIGRRQVIRGWDEGVMTMKVGGKRKLIIPPDLGYGQRGAGNVIPPDSTLIFEVELLGVGN